MAADASLALALPPLPAAMALEVFARVPADTRMRCAEVCRAWRAAVADVRLWRRLELTAAGGVERAHDARRVVALLRAGAARARGELHTLLLDVGCDLPHFENVVAEVTAHARSLRELLLSGHDGDFPSTVSVRSVTTLLAAAPHLRLCDLNVVCYHMSDACAMLQNEPPYESLRLRHLSVFGQRATQADVLSLCAAVVSHASLTSLALYEVLLDVPALIDSVVDAVLARGLSSFKLVRCRLSPASVPAMVRLLGGSALRTLVMHNSLVHNMNAAAELGDALRRNSTLTWLTLSGVRLWNEPEAAATLLDALVGHPSLRTLELDHNSFNGLAGASDVGGVLGALVAANTPALVELNLTDCVADDAFMQSLVAALPHNVHLRTLHMRGNDMSEDFVTEQLLPAVQANTGLRLLAVDDTFAAAREAMQLVVARNT